MTTILLLILGIVAISGVVFLIVRKPTKAEAEPLGYEAAPAVIVEEVVKKKRTAKPKVSKNTAKNKSLAKIEAKPKKTAKTKKK